MGEIKEKKINKTKNNKRNVIKSQQIGKKEQEQLQWQRSVIREEYISSK